MDESLVKYWIRFAALFAFELELKKWMCASEMINILRNVLNFQQFVIWSNRPTQQIIFFISITLGVFQLNLIRFIFNWLSSNYY